MTGPSGITMPPVRSNSDFKQVKFHVSSTSKINSDDILEKTTALAEQVRKVKGQFEKLKSSYYSDNSSSVKTITGMKGAVSELDNIAKQQPSLRKQKGQLLEKFLKNSPDDAQDAKILKLFKEIQTNLEFFGQVPFVKDKLLVNIRQLNPKFCCFSISIDTT